MKLVYKICIPLQWWHLLSMRIQNKRYYSWFSTHLLQRAPLKWHTNLYHQLHDIERVSINEIVSRNKVYNSIFDFCWSTVFAIVKWPIKWRRSDLRELISYCSMANLDFLLRFWNNKQYNELKTECFLLHDPTSFT